MSKYKINPRTGKFDIVGSELKSSDGSVEIEETAEGIDISVPLATEQNDGLESAVSKTIRDHSFANMISLASDNSYASAKDACAALMESDQEYYPVAGQMIQYIGADGNPHTNRYTGNYLIQKNGTKEFWCGATYDSRNRTWIINRCSTGKLSTVRSASGVYWQRTDYPESRYEFRHLIASSSFATAIMTGNKSQEYEITTQGGDVNTWMEKKVSFNGYYSSLKSCWIIDQGVAREALLFVSKGRTQSLTSAEGKDKEYIKQAEVLKSLGVDINVDEGHAPGDSCPDVEVVLDGSVENIFLIAKKDDPRNYKVVWIKRNADSISLVATYDFGSSPVSHIEYMSGKLCCYVGVHGTLDAQYSSFILDVNMQDGSLSLDKEYIDCHRVMVTKYGVVECRHKSIIVDGVQIELPDLNTESITSCAYDGDGRIIAVTGGHIYREGYGNIAMCIDLKKKVVMNNDYWEEFSLVTEALEGVVVSKNKKVEELKYDDYLRYKKEEAKLTVNASDRTTNYANYPLVSLSGEVACWSKVPALEMTDEQTKIYSDESCTNEMGVVAQHNYNPFNPNDVEVEIGGQRQVYAIAGKEPVSLATTKAVIESQRMTVDGECDDVCRYKLGGDWRLPTHAEWLELMENCTCVPDNQFFIITAPNGNSIRLRRRTDTEYYLSSNTLDSTEPWSSGEYFRAMAIFGNGSYNNDSQVYRCGSGYSSGGYIAEAVSETQGVDMGLSVRWANECLDGQYAFGEVESKDEFNFNNYKYGNHYEPWKYNDFDGKRVLDLGDRQTESVTFDANSNSIWVKTTRHEYKVGGRKSSYIDMSNTNLTVHVSDGADIYILQNARERSSILFAAERPGSYISKFQKGQIVSLYNDGHNAIEVLLMGGSNNNSYTLQPMSTMTLILGDDLSWRQFKDNGSSYAHNITYFKRGVTTSVQAAIDEIMSNLDDVERILNTING